MSKMNLKEKNELALTIGIGVVCYGIAAYGFYLLIPKSIIGLGFISICIAIMLFSAFKAIKILIKNNHE